MKTIACIFTPLFVYSSVAKSLVYYSFLISREQCGHGLTVFIVNVWLIDQIFSPFIRTFCLFNEGLLKCKTERCLLICI